MTNQIIAGSINQIAQQTGKSIAETFMGCDVVILVDTSCSMDQNDSRNGQSRYEIACSELRQLQSNLPGKIAVVSFSDQVLFCPSGIPHNFGGNTNLANGLRFIKMADVTGMRFILISDGEPNDEQAAIDIAKTFKNKIDVIFVGPEDRPAGRDFLSKLARATGGQQVTADRAKELASTVTGLLHSGK